MTSVASQKRQTTRTPAAKPRATPKKPKLRVVDGASLRRAARRRALVSLSVIGLVVTLFAVALLYAQLVKGQQAIDGLRTEIAEAEEERARLERDIAVVSTPDAILTRAAELGMVRAVDPQYLVAVRAAGPSDS